MRKIIIDKNTGNKIIKLYKSGIGCTKIGRKFDLCSPTIIDFLKENGIKIIGTKRHHCDVNFFEKIDTEEKAYWLGFLYADGCVRIRNKKYGEIRLKLTASDASHIKQFKNHINATSEIKIIDEKYKYKGKIKIAKSAKISIYSTKMANDLTSAGCMQNKSLKIKFPKWLDVSLIRHFIRGYFDGDGHVSLNYYNGIKHKQLYICSGSKEFIQSINDKLNFLSNMRFSIQRKNLYLIRTYAIDDIRQMYDYLYNDATVYLNRKYITIKNIINKDYVTTSNSLLRREIKYVK